MRRGCRAPARRPHGGDPDIPTPRARVRSARWSSPSSPQLCPRSAVRQPPLRKRKASITDATTGMSNASSLVARRACGAPQPGHAACLAQFLAVRRTGQRVHPRLQQVASPNRLRRVRARSAARRAGGSSCRCDAARSRRRSRAAPPTCSRPMTWPRWPRSPAATRPSRSSTPTTARPPNRTWRPTAPRSTCRPAPQPAAAFRRSTSWAARQLLPSKPPPRQDRMADGDRARPRSRLGDLPELQDRARRGFHRRHRRPRRGAVRGCAHDPDSRRDHRQLGRCSGEPDDPVGRQPGADWLQNTGTFTFPGIATVAASGDFGYLGAGQNSQCTSGFDPASCNVYPAALPGVTAAGGTTMVPANGTGTQAARGSERGGVVGHGLRL